MDEKKSSKLTYETVNELLEYINDNDILEDIKLSIELGKLNERHDINSLYREALSTSFSENKHLLNTLLNFFKAKKNMNIDKIQNKKLFLKLQLIKKIYQSQEEYYRKPDNPFYISYTSFTSDKDAKEIILYLERADKTNYSLMFTNNNMFMFINSIVDSLNGLLENYKSIEDAEICDEAIRDFSKSVGNLSKNLSRLIKNDSKARHEGEVACDNSNN